MCFNVSLQYSTIMKDTILPLSYTMQNTAVLVRFHDTKRIYWQGLNIGYVPIISSM